LDHRRHVGIFRLDGRFAARLRHEPFEALEFARVVFGTRERKPFAGRTD
jgi:hypothetical protein